MAGIAGVDASKVTGPKGRIRTLHDAEIYPKLREEPANLWSQASRSWSGVQRSVGSLAGRQCMRQKPSWINW